MATRQQPIRIGRINYTNVWPMFFYFPEERFGREVEMVPAVPTSLNQAMRRGEIDMGPISSFAYGQSCDDYLLFPDLSVSARGQVKSILLFHRKPIEDVLNGRIGLPTTSATSVNLLKILINTFSGGSPDYFYAEPRLEEMLREADAALLIGDDAIRADWRNRETGEYRVTDLGEWWNRMTGRWMTFAVWAVRRETVERDPERVAEVYRAFQHSKALSMAESGPLAGEAMAQIGGTQAYWRDYFANLCYDFNSQQMSGLGLYFEHAFELGLLDKPVNIRLWTDGRPYPSLTR